MMSEGFELVDHVAGPSLFVDALVVVVGAKVFEGGGGIGQEMEDDDQD